MRHQFVNAHSDNLSMNRWQACDLALKVLFTIGIAGKSVRRGLHGIFRCVCGCVRVHDNDGVLAPFAVIKIVEHVPRDPIDVGPWRHDVLFIACP